MVVRFFFIMLYTSDQFMSTGNTLKDTTINYTSILYFSACGFNLCIKLETWVFIIIRIAQNTGFGLINIGIYINQRIARIKLIINTISIALHLLRNWWLRATRKIWTEWENPFFLSTAKACTYMMVITNISTGF